eukprot:scaffold1428_cov98-Cylindrotheca_fusiformis.AAC.4
MFLRCENFNVKAAATRLIAFFRHKLSLFGPERLCKETIGQSDLDAEDLKCVTAGYVQLLPRRDHVGRAQLIYFSRFGHWATNDNAVSEMSLDAESRSEVSASDIDWLFAIHFVVKDDVLFLHGRIKLKMMYYFCMAALRDEETQKKGFVLIMHSVGNDGSNPKVQDPLLGWKCMPLMRKVLPMKLVGHHVCSSPSSGIRFFFSYVAKFFDSAGIARTRFHEGRFAGIQALASIACTAHFDHLTSVCLLLAGTFEEIDQKLAGFGINCVNLVISYEGDLKVDRHKEMIRSLKRLETQRSPAERYVILPMNTDVLLIGRGKPTQNHPGNVRLSLYCRISLGKVRWF